MVVQPTSINIAHNVTIACVMMQVVTPKLTFLMLLPSTPSMMGDDWLKGTQCLEVDWTSKDATHL